MLITQKRIEPYAPHLFGTMLSADNFVQNPEYSQSYNRYSYAFNNPLKYVDTSGYNADPPEKTGLGTYAYDGLQPHAVTSINN